MPAIHQMRRELRRLASRDDVEAQLRLALSLDADAPRDRGRALYWYEKAARNGHPTAKTKLRQRELLTKRMGERATRALALAMLFNLFVLADSTVVNAVASIGLVIFVALGMYFLIQSMTVFRPQSRVAFQRSSAQLGNPQEGRGGGATLLMALLPLIC